MQDYVGKQIDRYRITERLGMGGMAVVYKAYDTRLERDVAIKLIRVDEIPASQHERLMKRFEREAKAMAKFSHPNIVAVHDYGEVDGSPYLVMEYIPGGTLKDKTGQPIPVETAIGWITPIADALAYAHEFGIIHRDVKPSNILFDQKGRPILTDFGIAKILETDEATLTGTGMGVGTPEYMAPEQWQGKTSAATDQYALGVVLYELITGKKPYSADTPAAIAILQATEPLTPPSKLVRGVPEAVEKVLYKALARNPEDRYEDMAAFQGALEGLQSDKEKPSLEPAKVPAAISSESVRSESRTVDALDTEPVEGYHIRDKSAGKQKFPNWLMGLGAGLLLIGLAIGIIHVLGGTKENRPVPITDIDTDTPVTTETTGVPTQTLTSTDAHTSAPTEIPTITPFQEQTLGIGSQKIREVDGMEMVFVPSGEFTMGISEDEIKWLKEQEWCTNENGCQQSSFFSETPSNIVFTNAFWIDIHEVTKNQYNKCVELGVCESPTAEIWSYEHFGKENSSEYPVTTVNWFQAQTYCEWVGGRLPTEAEWEKAARGTDARIFPWGDNVPTANLANFDVYSDYVSQVGKFPDGASPYGALDMAGNAWEWVSDWYEDDYYETNDDWINPTGPSTGDYRVMRGGSTSVRWIVRTTTRFSDLPGNPDFLNYSIGFRCVMEVKLP